MCLGVPGKIIEVVETGGLKMGKVDFGGVIKEACLAYVPGAKVGDYYIIHVGFALSILNEEEAMASLDSIKLIAELNEALGVGN
jgi:hydrogenase expression/formation protein HypC